MGTDNKLLKAIYDKYHNILKCSSGWIWEVNEKGEYVFISDKIKDLLGYEVNEVLKKTIFDFLISEDTIICKEIFERSVIAEIPIINLDLSRIAKNGDIVFIRFNAIPLSGTNGCAGFFGIENNITSQRQYEQKLIHAKNKAERSSKVKSELLVNMSHELRTPLNAIIGISNTLNKYNSENLSEKQKEGLKMIHAQGKRLLDQINDILDLSKVEAGKMTVNNKRLAVKDLLVSIEQIINILLIGKPVNFIIQNNIPDHAQILTDTLKLQQVMVNLLGNAVKFTKKGTIELNCYIEETSAVFSITDTGIGIEEDNLSLIFKEYEQVDNKNISGKIEGTGLGLALSKKLIRLLRGDISVKSEVNIGTTFIVRIPVNY